MLPALGEPVEQPFFAGLGLEVSLCRYFQNGYIQRLIGYQKAAELNLTGRMISADEAKTLGILLEVVEHEQLMDRAMELAQRMADKPPQALRMTKRLLKSAQKMELPEFLEQCALMQGICHNTEDHLEAVNAFVEKRTPSYQGR